MKVNKTLSRRVTSLIGSDRFFWAVIALFVIQAGWIALSGRYPMAFDEDFHLGIIRLYSHHLNPFWSGSPAGSEGLGAVARDPSYLYHYLMSFPYRLLNSLHFSFFAQVVFLRMLNIGLLATGLAIYRRLLLKTKASKAMVHFSLLVTSLIPATTLLGAQINYDNLFIPLVGLSLLLTIKLYENTTSSIFDIKSFLQLVLVCFAASLVKYAFLPVFATLLALIVIYLFRHRKHSRKNLLSPIVQGWKVVSTPTAIALVFLTVILSGLFVERYGINLIRYHKPVADCAEVLDYAHCQYYGPWIRDYNFEHSRGHVNKNPAIYSQHWLYGMWFRSVFAVDGPSSLHQTRGPLAIPGVSLVVFAIVSVLALIINAKKIWKIYNRAVLIVLASVSIVYVAALWLEDFRLYITTGQPVAINGRYLLPVLPLLVLMSSMAVNEMLKKRPQLRIWAMTLIVVCLAWGGGGLTYILRSNDAWYWPNDKIVLYGNHAVQKVLGPATPGYYNINLFLH